MCVVCGRLATECSAHFACCIWLCAQHTAQFHEPSHIEKLRAGPTTAAVLEAVAAWVKFAIDRWVEECRA